jgi:hypothetical protein
MKKKKCHTVKIIPKSKSWKEEKSIHHAHKYTIADFPGLIHVLQYKVAVLINVREHGIGNKKSTIHSNWQHMVHKQSKNTIQYV